LYVNSISIDLTILSLTVETVGFSRRVKPKALLLVKLRVSPIVETLGDLVLKQVFPADCPLV